MRNFLAVLLLVVAITLCHAQSTPVKPVEPTAIGIVYRVDPANQSLMKLPDEPWKQNFQGCGFGKGCSFVVVSGSSSTYRIKANEKTEFVFQTGTPEKVTLYRFDQKKKNRQFMIEKMTTRGVEAIRGLPVEVSRFGDSSYKLVPATPLTPGEYAITIAGEIFTFGVD